MNHPVLGPDDGRDLGVQPTFPHDRLELGAVDDRGGLHRDEEVDAAGKPLFAVRAEMHSAWTSASRQRRAAPRAAAVCSLIRRASGLLELQNVPITVPWPEEVLPVAVDAPARDLELYNCHIPPGSQYGWKKVETFEGLFKHLARPADRPRFLCGDFNTPQAERANGTVITWGQRMSDSGAVQIKRRIRGGPRERWDAAERSILTGLAAHDLTDVFRRLHGYGVAEFSWCLKRLGKFRDSRFDHVFASATLNPVECRYVHAWREIGLSDHSALEVEFEPLVASQVR